MLVTGWTPNSSNSSQLVVSNRMLWKLLCEGTTKNCNNTSHLLTLPLDKFILDAPDSGFTSSSYTPLQISRYSCRVIQSWGSRSSALPITTHQNQFDISNITYVLKFNNHFVQPIKSHGLATPTLSLTSLTPVDDIKRVKNNSEHKSTGMAKKWGTNVLQETRFHNKLIKKGLTNVSRWCFYLFFFNPAEENQQGESSRAFFGWWVGGWVMVKNFSTSWQ